MKLLTQSHKVCCDSEIESTFLDSHVGDDIGCNVIQKFSDFCRLFIL